MSGFIKSLFVCKKELGLDRQPTREEYNKWRRNTKKRIWKGCGHKHQVILLCDDELCFSMYANFLMLNDEDLCFDCWKKVSEPNIEGEESGSERV